MKKISSYRYTFKKMLDYVGAAFLAFLLIFLWQLYRGPIEVPFLKPYIIKALNHDDSSYQVSLDTVNIELVRSIQPIKIIAKNVTYRKNDDTFIVNAPNTSVSFSIRALLHGVIAPSSINVNDPAIYIFTSYGVNKTSDNNLTRKKLEYYFDGFEEFIERFNSEDNSYSESYINEIRVNNAEVEFHEVELGRKWMLSDLNYYFERGYSDIGTGFNASLKLNENSSTTIGLDANFTPLTSKLNLQLYFADLIPADLFDNILEEKLQQKLYSVKLPINGRIESIVDFNEVRKNKDDVYKSVDTAFKKISIAIEGGQGDIRFSDKEEYNYAISSFMLGGEISAGLDKLNIHNADFDLGGQKTKVSFNVSGLKKYFFENSLEDIKISFKANIDKLNFDKLYTYWPRYVAEDAWLWCKHSIHGGEAANAEFIFDFAYDKKQKELAFQNLQGSVDIVDSNLNYLKGMPDINHIYGTALFSPQNLTIHIDKGISDGVIMTGGYVKLKDLDKKNNFAEIKIETESSITDALKLIDNPPLAYAAEMGLKPDSFSGSAETKLGLNFELKSDLKPEEVKVDVASLLHDVRIPNVIADKEISAQELSLKVTNSGMLINGEASFDDIPLQLHWDESFGRKNYRSKYKLGFKYNDAFKKKFGLEKYNVLNKPYISGNADVEADVIAYADGKYDVKLNANMVDTELDFSFLGLLKHWGEKANLKVVLIIENGKLTSIPSLAFSKSDFNLKGKISLDDKGQVKIVEIGDIQGPKTSARAKIEFANTPKQKIKINVSGISYDLSVFFASGNNKVSDVSNLPPKPDKDKLEDVTDMDINIAVNRLWTNPDIAVRNFAGNAKLRNGIGIEEMRVIGNYDTSPKSFLRLNYEPRPNKEYMLNIESNDAGNTMKVLHIYDNMRGGHLNIQAVRQANKKVVGHAKIRNFSLHNTPILAKLLTLSSLTGIVNMLTGEGLNFSHFDAPFSYDNQVLSVDDGRAFGTVMGISASGSYDKYYNELKIKGMFAPAYSLNTMLGKIPLVGNLLSGKDGTVFAANYEITGNLDNPSINYNPLSALSPNSLKEMFASIFGKNDE
ncbi:MAG: AsmA-like C-terminal domain-containing protein [Alphaproteobacteria bacterium]|nr:AsmA-like C-terminal domain-containing protein [Alphaproteobacteria bacterium]